MRSGYVVVNVVVVVVVVHSCGYLPHRLTTIPNTTT